MKIINNMLKTNYLTIAFSLFCIPMHLFGSDCPSLEGSLIGFIDQDVLSIDQIDGSKTVLGQTTLTNPLNATYNPIDEKFYIADAQADGYHIATVDACLNVVDLGLAKDNNDATIVTIEGISYNPDDEAVYIAGSGSGSATWQSNYLYKYSTVDNNATLVTTVTNSVQNDIDEMQFSNNGLIANDNNPNVKLAMFNVNLSDGTSTDYNLTINPSGMAYDWDNDIFYASIGTGINVLDNTVYEIETYLGDPITDTEYSRVSIAAIAHVSGKEIIIVGTSVLEGETNFEAFAYPNPTSDVLYITGDFDQIEIIDINGIVVMSELNSTSIDVSELTSGQYLVRLINGSGVSTQVISKQ